VLWERSGITCGLVMIMMGFTCRKCWRE